VTNEHLDTARFQAINLRLHASEGLANVRREVLLAVFGWLLIVVSLLLPIALIRDLHLSPWFVGLHVLTNLTLFGVWLTRARLSSGVIAITMLGALYLIGTLALLRLGIAATTFFGYALLVIATPLIFGRRAGWYTIVACGAAYVAIAVLATSGVLVYQGDMGAYLAAPANWFYAGTAFAAFAVVTVALSGTVHGKIDQLVLNEEKRRQMLNVSNERLAEANERLREMNEHLESRFAERTQRLEQANRELESFSYTVSHDLRSPLQVIEGFSALALQEETMRLPDKARDYLHRIQASARRMHDMIGHLLAFSELASVPMHTVETNLSDLAHAIVTDLQVTDPSRQVEIVVQPSMTASVDPALIVNVLHNLLANAWKFTGRTAQARIEFACEREGDECIYVVRDNGAGFSDTKAERLFQPFARLHDKRDFSGTGIGLATARRIIERHGGRIWARSKVGEGAAFLFTLGEPEPAVSATSVPARQRSSGA
jgi:signal transduction histidine kinase